jgi:DNA-binding LacI/PurR family transcriptional regulator
LSFCPSDADDSGGTLRGVSAVTRPAVPADGETGEALVTMPDVARRAGVSVSTVSRALRGSAKVAPETRRRVEQAASELSFAVSRTASSLATGRTGRVAAVVPQLGMWFPAKLLDGAQSALRVGGLDLIVYCIGSMDERRAFFDRLPARRNADALIVASFTLDEAERGRLDALGMPVIFASQRVAGRPSVFVDDVEGARQGTRYLVNLGHRRIAYLRPAKAPGFRWSAGGRETGFHQALNEAKIPTHDQLVVDTAPRAEGGMQAMSELLTYRHPPTAVFAENDEMAIGALQALRRAQVPVPGGMSVVGFDDHDLAVALDLTTVAQPVTDIGLRAGELAVAVAGGRHAPTEVQLPTRLLLRGTTGPPKRS